MTRRGPEPARLADDDPAPRVGAVALVVLVGLGAAVLEAVPLGLALYGAVLLTAWARGRWDPTWNDGDAGIAAGGALVLAVVVTVAVLAVRSIARAGRLPVARTVCVVTVCSLALALTPVLAIATRGAGF